MVKTQIYEAEIQEINCPDCGGQAIAQELGNGQYFSYCQDCSWSKTEHLQDLPKLPKQPIKLVPNEWITLPY